MSASHQIDHLPETIDLAPLNQLQRRRAVKGRVRLLKPPRQFLLLDDLTKRLVKSFDFDEPATCIRPRRTRSILQLAELALGDAENTSHSRLIEIESLPKRLETRRPRDALASLRSAGSAGRLRPTASGAGRIGSTVGEGHTKSVTGDGGQSSESACIYAHPASTPSIRLAGARFSTKMIIL